MKVLSISNFIEYLHATPSRRTAILRNAIIPSIYLMDRYGITQKAASRALCSRSNEPFALAYKWARNIKPRSAPHGQRLANTLQSLEKCEQILPFILDRPTHFSQAPQKSFVFDLGGLTIRISPQAIEQREKGSLIGLTRFHCSKSFSLKDEAAKDYTVLLNWSAEVNLDGMGKVLPGLCLAVDVFAQSYSTAPPQQIRRRKMMIDCAEEISDRWDNFANRLLRGRGFGKAA